MSIYNQDIKRQQKQTKKTPQVYNIQYLLWK